MIAYVFPGQGSQHKEMTKFLLDEFSLANDTLEEASDHLGFDMKKLILQDPENKLNLTEFTQPALLCASTIYQRCFQSINNSKISFVAGHSLGEYSALVASNALSFKDALKLSHARGQFMQEAVPVGNGAMLAVLGASEEKLEEALKNGPKDLQIANYNCPGQIVISGSKKAIEDFKKIEAKEKYGEKWKMIPLNVSAPFHSKLMQPAEDKMKERIENTSFKKPDFPIVQNYTAKEELEVSKIKQNLIKQITGPVRWTASIIRMKDLGVDKLIEMGPGKVLSGLAKKIDSSQIQAFNINDLDSFNNLAKKL